MRYSSARIRYLARKMLKNAKEQGVFDVISNEKIVISTIMETMERYFSLEDEVYEKVMSDLQKRSKKIIPGSVEWDVAFNKAFEEEMSKRLLR